MIPFDKDRVSRLSQSFSEQAVELQEPSRSRMYDVSRKLQRKNGLLESVMQFHVGDEGGIVDSKRNQGRRHTYLQPKMRQKSKNAAMQNVGP